MLNFKYKENIFGRKQKMKEETLYVEEIIKMLHALTPKNLKEVYLIIVRYYLKQFQKIKK